MTKDEILAEVALWQDKTLQVSENSFWDGSDVAESINSMSSLCALAAKKSGWDKDKNTRLPLDHSHWSDFPVQAALMLSELGEAVNADRTDAMDDHLPHRLGRDAELVDLLIRIFHYAGKKEINLGAIFVEKFLFNSMRADHKMEERKKIGGKKY